jgi:hypothetical protein
MSASAIMHSLTSWGGSRFAWAPEGTPRSPYENTALLAGFRLLEPIFDLSVECSVRRLRQAFKCLVPEIASV